MSDKEEIDEIAANISSGENISGMKDPAVKCGRFAGCQVFDVDPDTFTKTFYPKKKYKHWKKYMGLEDYSELGDSIRKHAKRNPQDGIIIRDSNSGVMKYIKHRKD